MKQSLPEIQAGDVTAWWDNKTKEYESYVMDDEGWLVSLKSGKTIKIRDLLLTHSFFMVHLRESLKRVLYV